MSVAHTWLLRALGLARSRRVREEVVATVARQRVGWIEPVENDHAQDGIEMSTPPDRPEPEGAERVRAHVLTLATPFTTAELQRALGGVSRSTLHNALDAMRRDGLVVHNGKPRRGSRWALVGVSDTHPSFVGPSTKAGLIRAHVLTLTTPFTSGEVCATLNACTPDTVRGVLDAMRGEGLLVHNGLTGPASLWAPAGRGGGHPGVLDERERKRRIESHVLALGEPFTCARVATDLEPISAGAVRRALEQMRQAGVIAHNGAHGSGARWARVGVTDGHPDFTGHSTKAARVRAHVLALDCPFTTADVTGALEDVSAPTVLGVLGAMRDEGVVTHNGVPGDGSRWALEGMSDGHPDFMAPEPRRPKATRIREHVLTMREPFTSSGVTRSLGDISRGSVHDTLCRMRDEGLIVHNGATGHGSRWARVGAGDAHPDFLEPTLVGSKTARIRDHVLALERPFTVPEVAGALVDVSTHTIGGVLRAMREQGLVIHNGKTRDLSRWAVVGVSDTHPDVVGSGPPGPKAARVRDHVLTRREVFNTTQVIEALADVSTHTVCQVLGAMREEGLVIHNGKTRGSLWGIVGVCDEFPECPGPDLSDSKATRARAHILALGTPFTVGEVSDALSGISSNTVRRVLRAMREEGLVAHNGKTNGSMWAVVGVSRGNEDALERSVKSRRIRAHVRTRTEPFTVAQIANALADVSTKTVGSVLAAMSEQGLIVHNGRRRGSLWAVVGVSDEHPDFLCPSLPGSRSARIRDHVRTLTEPFTPSRVAATLGDVSLPTVQRVLQAMSQEGLVAHNGKRGRYSRWSVVDASE